MFLPVRLQHLYSYKSLDLKSESEDFSFPYDSFSYNPNRDKKQLLCDYLNDYCPEFRQEVFNRFPPVYKNYKEGEVIDKSLMDLTYDKAVPRFPGACLDWNLLFDIVRPRA